MLHNSFLSGGGEMGDLIRTYDWQATSLGMPAVWHQSLLTSLNIMLTTRFPMLVFWGPDLITFYNDAFRPSLGNDGKHPGSLGQPGHISWAESWPVIGPMIYNIMAGGEAVWFEDQKLPIYREGKMGFAYWTYSFSPVLADDGRVGGVLVTCTETTKTVLAAEELDEQYKKVQRLNHELAITNEELYATNEQLNATNEEQVVINEELQQTQSELISAHSRIAESEARFRNMAETSDILIVTSDELMNTSYLNSAWYELTGVSIEDLMKFGWADRLHPDDKEPFLTHYQTAFNRRIYFSGEFRIKNRKGEYRWLCVRCPPLFRTDGSFAGYITSAIDITEQKADDQRKNDFIGMVSHEMKTPLTSLGGYIQLLQANAGTEDGFTQNMLAKADKQVNRITTLINGFLNVSRFESGKIQIDMQRFDMADLVKESEEEIRSLYKTHRIVFAPVETTFVNADRDKIGQVISNLISNAVKYSSPDTEINVACVNKERNMILSVKDEGIGIRDEDIHKLFERYYRVNEGSSMASGFGIGLYLCYEIIHRHNGKIWVDSEAGKGSTFSFCLPVQYP